MLVLFGLALLAAGLLCVPWRLPIGANYWDLYVFIDASNRIGWGQVPHVDFFAPSGALPFYLLALVLKFLPGAQPLLAAQYSTLLITLPLMVMVVGDLARRSPNMALALAIPFALFSLLPMNAIEFYPAPGVDGIGLYNRQSGLILYVLMAGLFAMLPGWRRDAVLAISLAALFFVKINVFAPAVVLIIYASVSGLLSARAAAQVCSGCLLLILVFGWPNGLLGAYLSDIGALIAHNRGNALPRLMTQLSVKFDVVASLALLVAVLLWHDRHHFPSLVTKVFRGAVSHRFASLRQVLTLDGITLGVASIMALAVEMQNTGSQEYIFLWPLLLVIVVKQRASSLSHAQPARFVMMLMLAAVTIPTLSTVLHRSARVLAVMPGYQAIAVPQLKLLNTASAKDMLLDHARAMDIHYPASREALTALSRQNQMPSTILLSEIEFQTFYLLDLERAVTDIRRLETVRGLPFASVYTLDTNDMMPYALGLEPLRNVTVSFDLGRGFAALRHDRLVAAIATADAILLPRCPVTPFRLNLEALAAPALLARKITRLNNCWDIAIRD